MALSVHSSAADWTLRGMPFALGTPYRTIPYHNITYHLLLALGTAATSSGLIDILRHLEPGLSSEAYLRQFHAL